MDGTQISNLKHDVTYTDLREYIDEVDKLGELRRIDGASWEEDIGLATELLQHSEAAPSALFDEIPGFPKGHRVFTNFFGGQRQNITLGFPAHLNKFELSQAFNHAFKEIIQHPISYEVVETGPVMENVMEGGDVNVLLFPTPLWHAEDGGRYIDTGSFNITRNPATQIDIIKSTWSTGLDPSIHPDRKAVGDTTNSRAIINAGRPFHWKDRYPKVSLPDPEVWAKAKEKWD